MRSTTQNNEIYQNGLSPRLNDAIESLSKPLLRAIVRDICINVPGARDYATNKLFVAYDDSKDDDDDQSSTASSSEGEDGERENTKPEKKPGAAPAPIAGTKRLRLRYVRCENCEQQFDIVTNTATSCRYHPEYSEPDYDLFVDHDEDCHGTIDSSEMREQFPEKFIYPCCDRTGVEEPCTVDWHRESDYAKKFRR
ncbi:hypothetical protein C8Q69DRAFT_113590 [Paecilomyces variotii]|uniref:Uncharacterized protein n=1 Tax=Byssochlamys spectabilis TaxID=264951 RepID=A0A443HJL5_BYSSP|nr:hypothetical protein C8Q69DRAFT_113590 [Paecilomyces variotii]KAJ9205249.1 hypothetical protein DTO032I3_2452 [Paecilomyces variotii]KAJ9280238.1 hypothetical protein DTO021D3_2826 [Paecilomyces variotii]KAJ9343052.1 hypothetical protein DTO027B6_4327 [Paecilomyces variotii]KAJ9359746.1 hypothetical protein DTO027B9_1794 [Paecilomyces variotii]KAJ9361256.1 hypothetical protein DTO280E4_4003 [Paecilomyces variotii]